MMSHTVYHVIPCLWPMDPRFLSGSVTGNAFFTPHAVAEIILGRPREFIVTKTTWPSPGAPETRLLTTVGLTHLLFEDVVGILEAL